MLRSAQRVSTCVLPVMSVATIPARFMGVKSAKISKKKDSGPRVFPRNPIGNKNSLLETIHRKRLMHWPEARAAVPTLPEAIPEDIHLKVDMWPSPKFASGLRVYREHWTRYAEPSYTVITRVKDNENTSKIWGVETFRGITEATEKRLTGTRKADWRVLPSDEPVLEAWEKARASNGSVLELPPCPKYAPVITEASS